MNIFQTTRYAAWKLLGSSTAQPVRAGLAFAIGERRFNRVLLGARLDATRKEILGAFLANGHPPKVETLPAKLDRPEAKLRDDLDELARRGVIRLDEHGEISIVHPFSVAPTSHRVRFASDREVYASCALGALGILLFAGGAGELRSTCPHTKKELRVLLRRGHLAERSSDGCVLVVIGEKRLISELYGNGHFVASSKDATAWLKGLRPVRGRAFSLRTALILAKLLFDDRFEVPEAEPLRSAATAREAQHPPSKIHGRSDQPDVPVA